MEIYIKKILTKLKIKWWNNLIRINELAILYLPKYWILLFYIFLDNIQVILVVLFITFFGPKMNTILSEFALIFINVFHLLLCNILFIFHQKIKNNINFNIFKLNYFIIFLFIKKYNFNFKY